MREVVVVSAILRLWAREPALIIGAISAVISLVVGFGTSQDRVGLIMAVVVAVSAVVTRSQVSPVGSTPPPPTITQV